MKKIILLGLILRLIVIFLSRNINNYDLDSYFLVGQLTVKGINIYSQIAALHHPYFPAFLYIEAAAFCLGRLGALGRLETLAIIKIIINLFDLGNIYLIYLLSKKNLKKAFLYSVNPVSILIFCLHGQFDAIPVFFMLLSLYLISFSRHSREGGNPERFAILLYSFSVMLKTWPLLFFFTLYKRLTNKKLILWIVLFPILSILIYSFIFGISVIRIVKTIANYQGLWGIWGLWGIFGTIRLRWQKLFTVIFLMLFFGYSIFIKRKKAVSEIFDLLFFFFVFTTNFSSQYFSWWIPFLTLRKPKYFWKVILTITFFLTIVYMQWIFPQFSQKILTVSGLIAWLYLALIFFVAYRKKYIV